MNRLSSVSYRLCNVSNAIRSQTSISPNTKNGNVTAVPRPLQTFSSRIVPKYQARNFASGKSTKPNLAPIPGKVNTKDNSYTVNIKPATFDGIRKELMESIDKEVEEIKEYEKGSIDADLANKWLKESKFKLEEKDGDAILTRQDKDLKIEISFSTVEREDKDEDTPDEEEGYKGQDEDEEFDEEEEEEDEPRSPRKTNKKKDEEEDEEDIDEEDGSEDLRDKKPRRKDFLIELTFLDKQGKPKGKWALNAFSGENDRLFVESMATPPETPQIPTIEKASAEKTVAAAKPVELGEEEMEDYNVFEFDNMTQQFQDKVYDFLDVLGIDDQLAQFVRQYPSRYESKSQMEFLQTIKKFMS